MRVRGVRGEGKMIGCQFEEIAQRGRKGCKYHQEGINEVIDTKNGKRWFVCKAHYLHLGPAFDIYTGQSEKIV